MNRVRYRVCGRYKSGSEVTHYRMMRSDGVSEKATREKVIMLISKGLVDNMRLQVRSEDDIIIRGKGINLNELPVIKEEAVNLGQECKDTRYMATKRLMYGVKCIGYILEDYKGNCKSVRKKEVQELAIDKKIKNIEVKKFIDKSGNSSKLVIRGVGCNLLSLEVVPVDENGNIVNKKGASCRAIFMKESGILEDLKTHTFKKFGINTFIVYGVGGNIEILSMEEMKRNYTVDSNSSVATSDSYLDSCNRYRIKFTSGKETKIEAEKILKWTIARKR